ncbi:DUF2971 domain-containing protein [Thaumasiovibrio sp. DFM-14]|uniref:DUF2971 domain-containing protein n=1 Tax=Thaumasiovibrio sp. DFM-14 TaxID=3384792 RepID=UPI0039A39B0D
MNNLSNEKIINLIDERKLSKLAFLDECWRSSEDEWHSGFYYFIKDLKIEDKTEVFQHVVSRFGNESDAYCYLGKTANMIFQEKDVSNYFFKKAIELNPYHKVANWELYKSCYDIKYALVSIAEHYKSGEFKEISLKVDRICVTKNDTLQISEHEWEEIKLILEDNRIPQYNKFDLLILANLRLDCWDSGVDAIRSSYYVESDILQDYYNKGLITLETVLDKLSSFDVRNFVSDNYNRAYLHFIDTKNYTQLQYLAEEIISIAFKNSDFSCVCECYEKIDGDKICYSSSPVFLYYQMSLIEEGRSLQSKDESIIIRNSYLYRDESKALYLAFLVKKHLKKIEVLFSQEKYLNSNIRNIQSYILARKKLDSVDLLNHFIHERLEDELNNLVDKWDDAYNRERLDELKRKFLVQEINGEELEQMILLSINCKMYDYAINLIENYHESNFPTVDTRRYLGCCYKSKNIHERAVVEYNHALEIMHSAKDYDHYVISEIVHYSKEHNLQIISDKDFKLLKKEFNIDICNSFKLPLYLSANGRGLFKYSTFNVNTIDSLINQYFYLSEKNQLNDPIEMPPLDGEDHNDLIDSNYRICSFSENSNSMLMWSHYADDHKGIMVEYRFGSFFPNGIGIGEVHYDENIKRNKNRGLFIFNQHLLTKNKEWSYENEVRVFSSQHKKVGFVKHHYPSHEHDKIDAEIACITLGYKFPNDQIELVKNLLSVINKRNNEGSQISLRQAYISNDNNFSLCYRDIAL